MKRDLIEPIGLTNAEKDEKLDQLLRLANYSDVYYRQEVAHFKARGAFGGIFVPIIIPPPPLSQGKVAASVMPGKPTIREQRIAKRRKEAYGL